MDDKPKAKPGGSPPTRLKLVHFTEQGGNYAETVRSQDERLQKNLERLASVIEMTASASRDQPLGIEDIIRGTETTIRQFVKIVSSWITPKGEDLREYEASLQRNAKFIEDHIQRAIARTQRNPSNTLGFIEGFTYAALLASMIPDKADMESLGGTLRAERSHAVRRAKVQVARQAILDLAKARGVFSPKDLVRLIREDPHAGIQVERNGDGWVFTVTRGPKANVHKWPIKDGSFTTLLSQIKKAGKS